MWPAKPVRFILPNSAGSSPDSLARIAAERFEKTLGQPFVIENRPGANFLIAAEAIRSANADGYTLKHSLAVTTLGGRAGGDRVNLEADTVAKYVERLLPDRSEQ